MSRHAHAATLFPIALPQMQCCACGNRIDVAPTLHWKVSKITVYYTLVPVVANSTRKHCCSCCMDLVYGTDNEARFRANRLWTTHFFLTCK
jgi:hypothetical protein